MARTVPAALLTHIGLEATTLAMCWKIVRRDGVVKTYTDHDVAIVYASETYTPVESGSLSNQRQSANLAPESIDIEMIFASDTGTDAELRAGLYDYAQIWTFLINWADPTMGIVKLACGRLGEVEIRDNHAKIELRSLAQLLSARIGRIYTPECDATLGDARCGVALAGYTHSGAVAVVTSNKIFTITGAASGKIYAYYSYGKITFTSGLNNGLSMQVELYSVPTETMVLFEPMPFTVAAGDTFTAIAGCDRRFVICKDWFSNQVNFRGFPHIPGMDKALTVPANQKWTED